LQATPATREPPRSGLPSFLGAGRNQSRRVARLRRVPELNTPVLHDPSVEEPFAVPVENTRSGPTPCPDGGRGSLAPPRHSAGNQPMSWCSAGARVSKCDPAICARSPQQGGSPFGRRSGKRTDPTTKPRARGWSSVPRLDACGRAQNQDAVKFDQPSAIPHPPSPPAPTRDLEDGRPVSEGTGSRSSTRYLLPGLPMVAPALPSDSSTTILDLVLPSGRRPGAIVDPVQS